MGGLACTRICAVYILYFGQGNHQIYGHIWFCIYTVLANPTYVQHITHGTRVEWVAVHLGASRTSRCTFNSHFVALKTPMMHAFIFTSRCVHVYTR